MTPKCVKLKTKLSIWKTKFISPKKFIVLINIGNYFKLLVFLSKGVSCFINPFINENGELLIIIRMVLFH
jgi:hypothetical protein